MGNYKSALNLVAAKNSNLKDVLVVTEQYQFLYRKKHRGGNGTLKFEISN